MSNVIETIPIDMQAVFVETLGAVDPELLLALHAAGEPTRAQREAVLDILSTEFCRHLQPDDEPTERGKLIDNTLGAFLLRWPIENESAG